MHFSAMSGEWLLINPGAGQSFLPGCPTVAWSGGDPRNLGPRNLGLKSEAKPDFRIARPEISRICILTCIQRTLWVRRPTVGYFEARMTNDQGCSVRRNHRPARGVPRKRLHAQGCRRVQRRQGKGQPVPASRANQNASRQPSRGTSEA